MIKRFGRHIYREGPEVIICKRNNIHRYSFWNSLKERGGPLKKTDTPNLFYSKKLEKHIFLIDKGTEEEGFVESLKKIKETGLKKIFIKTTFIKDEKLLVKRIKEIDQEFDDTFEFYIISFNFNLYKLSQKENLGFVKTKEN